MTEVERPTWQEQQEWWIGWLSSVGFVAKNKLTLTFDTEDRVENGVTVHHAKHPNGVTVNQALWWWRRLVTELNVSAYGKRYTKRFGHSYFSYVVGVEFQQRGTVHLHVVINEYVDYEFIHDYWNDHCGFAWVDPCKDSDHDTRYALKYAMKGGHELKADECLYLRQVGPDTPITVLSAPVPKRYRRPVKSPPSRPYSEAVAKAMREGKPSTDE